MVDDAIRSITTKLVVRTGFLRQNFIDSFTKGFANTNGLKVYTVWFDSNRFFLTVIYAKQVFDKYNYWSGFPFVAHSGNNAVNLVDLNFNISEFASKSKIDPKIISIQGNKLVVRTST